MAETASGPRLVQGAPARAVLDARAHWLLLIVAVLLGFGLIMVYSTRAPQVARVHGLGASWDPLFEQGVKILIGLGFLAAGILVRPSWLLQWHKPLMAAAVLLLLLVCVPGIGARINGARRWFVFGPVVFQPVEFARIALIVFIAARVRKVGPRIGEFQVGLLPVAAVLAILMVLLLLQPDFGSTVFMLGLGTLLLILGGARVRHFLIMAAVGLPVCLAYAMTSLSHVQDRFRQFIDPAMGEQARQSLLALGSGGLTGADLGAGMAKLGYLPMISSDFILAGIGEELGFVGTSLVVLLFLLFTVLATSIVVMQRCPGHFVIGAGVTLSIALQAVINVAVVTAAVPTKGIALPFISSGGSSLVSSLFGVGLLIGMARAEGGQEAGAWTRLRALLADDDGLVQEGSHG